MRANPRAPSLSRLMAAFPSVAPVRLEAIRTIIRNGGTLGQCDNLLGTFGLEYIRNARGDTVAAYLNSGETYAPTLLRVTGSGTVQLTTLGDFVESYERRHARLP